MRYEYESGEFDEKLTKLLVAMEVPDIYGLIPALKRFFDENTRTYSEGYDDGMQAAADMRSLE